MGITKIAVKEQPRWTAMSQAQKQPVQIEADQRLQERFIKKMTLSGLCLKILRGVYRVGRELGLD